MAPFALKQVSHTLKVVGHNKATLNFPSVFTAAFNSHVPLQTGAGISTGQTIAIDGLATHVGLKGFIVAGEAISSVQLIIGNIEAIRGENNISGQVFAFAFHRPEFAYHFTVAHIDLCGLLDCIIFCHRSFVLSFRWVMGMPNFIQR